MSTAARTLMGLLRSCSYRLRKWRRTKQTFIPAGHEPSLLPAKSVSGSLTALGGIVAGEWSLRLGAGSRLAKPSRGDARWSHVLDWVTVWVTSATRCHRAR